jgi:Flp pilus assembly protein TadG
MKTAQRGATTIELAFVLVTFFMFLLGVLDFSRMLFTWNAATEAARLGARYAVVCATTSSQALALTKMRAMVPEIGGATLAWEPAGCDTTSCEAVTVTITGLNLHWLSPVTGLVLPVRALPSFSTRFPREMMGQDPNNSVICQ